MAIEISAPDLTTPEGTRKALHDVHAAARALQGENGELRTQLAALTTARRVSRSPHSRR